ncbi:MAG: ApaG domain, partial [Planctomycetota bacterium]|nr:ApaG domain [Planctomycetota bacterium]
MTSDQETRTSRGSEAVTRGFRVSVEPAYVPEQSRPEAPQFVFSYRITITNESARAARLLRR